LGTIAVGVREGDEDEKEVVDGNSLEGRLQLALERCMRKPWACVHKVHKTSRARVWARVQVRVARGDRQAPNGTSTGAASKRATTTATAGKGRVVVCVGASSGRSAARAVGEKENTPERINVNHVKENDGEKVMLPSVAVKCGRAHKADAAIVLKA